MAVLSKNQELVAKLMVHHLLLLLLLGQTGNRTGDHPYSGLVRSF